MVCVLALSLLGVPAPLNTNADLVESAVDDQLAYQATKLWEFGTHGSPYNTILSNGYIYTFSQVYGSGVQSNLYCIDAITGNKVWEHEDTTGYANGLAVSQGRVFFLVGGFYSKLQCLNALNGDSLWNYSGSFYESRAVLPVGDYVYVSTRDGESVFVSALNAATGHQIWTYTAPEGYPFSLSFSEGYLYAVRNGEINVFDSLNGKKIWNAQFSGIPDSTKVANGIVYISTNYINSDGLKNNGKIYAFNSQTGSNIWIFKTADFVTPPAFYDTAVLFGSGYSTVHALNSLSGEELWNFTDSDNFTPASNPTPPPGPAANSDGVFASMGNNLYCLERSSGRKIWNYRTDRPLYVSPVVVEGKLYVGSGEQPENWGYYPVWHKFYALNASSGAELWTYDVKNSVNSPPIVKGDTVYVSLYDVKENAFDFGSGSILALKESTYLKPPEPTPLPPINTPPPGALIVPDHYPTIQEAAKNASDDGTIFVRRGTYYVGQFEGMTIRNSTSIIGENPANTIINGQLDKYSSGYRGDLPHAIIFTIEAPNVSITGFTFTNCPRLISIERDNCSIAGNTFSNSRTGIRLLSEHNIIAYNNFTWIRDECIIINRANQIISKNNIFGNHTKGIYLAEGYNVTIAQNSIVGVWQGDNSQNSANTEEAKGGIYLEGTGPNYIYENNITNHESYGVQFGPNCNASIVFQNNISHNGVGVSLFNYIVSDYNPAGIYNRVYGNNITDNTKNAFVQPPRLEYGTVYSNGTDIVQWDDGAVGNFWGDYQSRYPNAKEVGNSGIGDTHYEIDENNVDRFPRIRAFSQAEPPNFTIPPSSLPSTPFPTTIAAIALGVAVVVVVLAVTVIILRRKLTRPP